MLLRIPIVPNPAYLGRFSGGLWWFEAACLVKLKANHHKSSQKCRKYAEFGTLYSCAGEKHAVLVLCDVQCFRAICRLYWVFRSVRTFQ